VANNNAPNGFRPRIHADGTPYNSALNRYPIAYNYGTAIYIGDPVKIVSGKINIAAATDQIRGILVGFEFPKVAAFPQMPGYWPANGFTTLGNADVNVLVVDDPGVLFEAQFVNSTSAPTQADVGKYFKHIAAAGNGSTGISQIGLDYATASTTVSGFVWKLIRFVERVDNDPGAAYARGLFLPILHDFRASASAA
jgi:hypothetical protein